MSDSSEFCALLHDVPVLREVGVGVETLPVLSLGLFVVSDLSRIRGIGMFGTRCELAKDRRKALLLRGVCEGCLTLAASAACLALCRSLAAVFLSPYGAVGK